MFEITMNIKPDYFGDALKKAASFFKKEETLSNDAFLVLLNPIKDHLYNFIHKAMCFSNDSDDVFQETILRAFKYRNSYDVNASFKTWIFSIALNEIKCHYNKNKKSPSTQSVELEDHLHIVDDSADKKMVRDIYEVAQQLTPNQQRVFFLFYDDRFSITEISEITGLKEGNIKFILNQAREKIKQKLSSGYDGKVTDRSYR